MVVILKKGGPVSIRLANYIKIQGNVCVLRVGRCCCVLYVIIRVTDVSVWVLFCLKLESSPMV